MRALLLVIALFCVTGNAAAGFLVNAAPEPGVIELLSIGAIAGLIVTLRKRRK